MDDLLTEEDVVFLPVDEVAAEDDVNVHLVSMLPALLCSRH